MILTPGSWISRIAALTILVALLLAAYHLIARPALGLYRANEQRIEQQSDLLQRYRRLAAGRADLAAGLAELDDRGDVTRGYWEGPSDALASAQLQDSASDAIQGNGGQVVSVQTRNAGETEEDATTRRAELGLRLSTDVDDLALILRDLETATPYMFIDRLVVSPGRTRQRGESAVGETALDVRLDVFGYLQNVEPRSPDRSQTGG